MVPYIFRGNQWIGYEDEDSLEIKMNFVKSGGYSGAMTWAIDMDDFRNLCGRGNHSMMRVIYESLKDHIVPKSPPIPTTTAKVWWKPDTTTTTTSRPTLVPSSVESSANPIDPNRVGSDCSGQTYWAHTDCDKVSLMQRSSVPIGRFE